MARISLKLFGTRSIVPAAVARPRDVRQEVRAVPQPVAEGAVQVRAIVEHVHLVDDALPASRSALASMASSTETGSPLAIGTIMSASGPM